MADLLFLFIFYLPLKFLIKPNFFHFSQKFNNFALLCLKINLMFLKVVFIIIVIYYLFKLFMRYIAPYLISAFIKKAQDRMMNNMGGQAEANPQKEGEVNVDYVPQKKKPGKKDELGDVIDFEEVKE